MLTCVLSLRVSTTPFQTLDTAILLTQKVIFLFYEPENGADMVPEIRVNVRKEEAKLWGGYILQIGENSIV
jgi:hypothetical protein